MLRGVCTNQLTSLSDSKVIFGIGLCLNMPMRDKFIKIKFQYKDLRNVKNKFQNFSQTNFWSSVFFRRTSAWFVTVQAFSPSAKWSSSLAWSSDVCALVNSQTNSDEREQCWLVIFYPYDVIRWRSWDKFWLWKPKYIITTFHYAFHGFRHPEFSHGGLVWGSYQFLLISQLP